MLYILARRNLSLVFTRLITGQLCRFTCPGCQETKHHTVERAASFVQRLGHHRPTYSVLYGECCCGEALDDLPFSHLLASV